MTSDPLDKAWRDVAAMTDKEYWELILYMEMPQRRAKWIREEAIRRARDDE